MLTYIQGVRIFFFLATPHDIFKVIKYKLFMKRCVCVSQIYRNNMNISKNLALSYMIIQLYDCYNVDYKGSGCL